MPAASLGPPALGRILRTSERPVLRRGVQRACPLRGRRLRAVAGPASDHDRDSDVAREASKSIDEFSKDPDELIADAVELLHSDDPEEAFQGATDAHDIISTAVNARAKFVRRIQSIVVSAECIPRLLELARTSSHPVFFECLQILSYRNSSTCEELVKQGALEAAKDVLSDLDGGDPRVINACVFMLSGIVAFNPEVQDAVVESGVVARLALILNSKDEKFVKELGAREGTIHRRAATVIRNLAHRERFHAPLKQAGAVEGMSKLLKEDPDPASRINAAVALACLVGKEEEDVTMALSLEQVLVAQMLDVLSAAAEGRMKYGSFWTVWKLAMGLASLCVPDKNKTLIKDAGGVEVLANVLFGRHHDNNTTQRWTVTALWNLAFDEQCRKDIIATPGLVDALRELVKTSESSRTIEAAKGCLWTLGIEEDVQALHEAGRFTGGDAATGRHIMLSYEWGSQQKVLLIKNELEKAGYKCWMDVDQMSGSTLEAMAHAVENSEVVLVCVSKRYKESQACRTEAEYAFQQKKRIIPLLMDPSYRPSGWLGALLGTKLYFNFGGKGKEVQQRAVGLIKEIGDVAREKDVEVFQSARAANKYNVDRAEQWTDAEVSEWLTRNELGQYEEAFRGAHMNGKAVAGLQRVGQRDVRLLMEMLQSDFGVQSVGHRLRFLEELDTLFE
ncbi:unnamed protein product [Pedinophyceae sp. YPF-701]|nr:unnamed protein product [Pedinophyceae sp. YPF-701]